MNSRLKAGMNSEMNEWMNYKGIDKWMNEWMMNASVKYKKDAWISEIEEV